MKEIDITYDKFYSFKPLQKESVRKKGRFVYKYSPLTEHTVSRLYAKTEAKVLDHFSKPIAKLKCNGTYFGYIMYFRRLKHIKEAIHSGNINLLSNFLLELIQMIEELNKMDLTYWDFHSNNILVDKKGSPFIIDIDDIEYKAAKDLLYRQIEYLIEFIFNVMLNNNYSLQKVLNSEALKGILNQNTLSYITNICNQEERQQLLLPYHLVEELKDKDKVQTLKRRIK